MIYLPKVLRKVKNKAEHMAFFGLYLFIAVIFLLFSVINFCTYVILHKRKNELFYSIFFLLMAISYFVYAISKGLLVGGTMPTDFIGYVVDIGAVAVLIVSIVSDFRKNIVFYREIFKVKKS